MEQKAFRLIAEQVGEALSGQGFSAAGEQREEEGAAALFTAKETAYSVLFNEKKKRFELRTCDAEDGKPDGKWKSLSVWLFDPESDGASEAESISNDFVETIRGPKRVDAIKAKKKRKKDDENNPDPVFFFNRFAGIFPELRGELNAERAQYGDVRAVRFARGSLVPRVEALCAQDGGQEKAKRCGGLLNDMYVSGDMNVRSIITIVVLNGLSAAALENLEPQFSDELKRAAASARKWKGKTVKPEKRKKPVKFTAENLNTLRK